MFNSVIEFIGVFFFIVLSTVVLIPLVVSVFSFWKGFYGAVKKRAEK